MQDHIYKILELVGSSDKSVEDAIQNAVSRANATIRGMGWLRSFKREATSTMAEFITIRS